MRAPGHWTGAVCNRPPTSRLTDPTPTPHPTPNTHPKPITPHHTPHTQPNTQGIRISPGLSALTMNAPGIHFFYDFYPVMVEYSHRKQSFPQFLTSVFAVIGGIFTISRCGGARGSLCVWCFWVGWCVSWFFGRVDGGSVCPSGWSASCSPCRTNATNHTHAQHHRLAHLPVGARDQEAGMRGQGKDLVGTKASRQDKTRLCLM